MGLYDRYILPRLVHCACKVGPISKQRQKIVPLAYGQVLEIGIGSGLNVPWYDGSKVTRVLGVDPSQETWNQNTLDFDRLPFKVEFARTGADQIPESTSTFDSAVVTYSLCSISDVAPALAEVRRVLKPGGKIFFSEHGRSPDKAVLRTQRLINPMWRRLSGGCNLDRDIPIILQDHGFSIEDLHTMYIPGWRPASYNYWGVGRSM